MADSTAFQDRAAHVKGRLDRRGLSMAEIARQIGYPYESGTSYVRQVLRGDTVSNPILDRIEARLDQIEAEQEQQAA